MGKSTCLPHIVKFLESRGMEVVSTREPGGTAVAESIREILLWSEYEALDSVTELLLHFASRRQHLCEVIQPALDRGAWVICDRFTDATHAYQGGGSGLPAEWIDYLSDMVHPRVTPDLTLLFDLSPQEGLRRIASKKADRYEGESSAFLERVRENYIERAVSSRFSIVDASCDEESVRAEVLSAIDSLLESRK